MPVAWFCQRHPWGAGGRLNGVGHTVSVGAGVLLSVDVAVGDGISEGVGVDVGCVVAV